MALPSPVAALPDMSQFIEANRAKASQQAQQSLLGLAQWGQQAQSPASPMSPQLNALQEQQMPPQAMGMNGMGMAPDMAQWNNQNPQNQAQNSQNSQNIQDDWSQMGLGANVPRSLIGTESGGNWAASNNVAGAGGAGHDGFLQFGQARRAEAVAAGVIPEMSREEFRQNKQAQVAAANWHFDDIDKRIRQAGYDRLIGQTIGGAPITWDGMRAMAHLGGFGGLSKFINSSGAYNPADAYGTSLKKYAVTHSQGQY